MNEPIQLLLYILQHLDLHLILIIEQEDRLVHLLNLTLDLHLLPEQPQLLLGGVLVLGPVGGALVVLEAGVGGGFLYSVFLLFSDVV